MRQIKFRGKSLEDRTWVYGYFVRDLKADSIYWRFKKYPVDINTVGQTTGRKDKNGVEIYEGDILTDGGRKLPVSYDGGHWFGGGTFLSTVTNGNTEVIGNIYENPELLTKD